MCLLNELTAVLICQLHLITVCLSRSAHRTNYVMPCTKPC